tara:strand:+ start:563 stop:925 length:363 start_codon:yes stop_codon:yes gene_type:complete
MKQEHIQVFDAMFDAAYAAGQEAVNKALKPDPMYVTDGKQVWTVNDGPCGFSWVNVRNGRSAFAKYLKEFRKCHKSYQGGVDIWVSDYNQSIHYKEIHAAAMSAKLQTFGIAAFSYSRMD